MWNMIKTSVSSPYDKTMGDRAVADNSGRFKPIVLEVSIFQGQVTVKSSQNLEASEQDSAMALRIEQLIYRLFRPKTKPLTKQKQISDGKIIDV